MTGHKFTKLLKSVSWPWFTSWGKFQLLSLLDLWKMAFSLLNGKLTLFERTSKWNQSRCGYQGARNVSFSENFLYVNNGWPQRLFTLPIFFFVNAAFTAILSLNWKNNYTILTVSKIQRMRKLNTTTTTSFAGIFLTVVR